MHRIRDTFSSNANYFFHLLGMKSAPSFIGNMSSYGIPVETAEQVQLQYQDLSNAGVIFTGNTGTESTKGNVETLLRSVEGSIQLLQVLGMATEVNNGVLSAVQIELVAKGAQEQLQKACQVAGDTEPIVLDDLVQKNLSKIEDNQPLSGMHPQVACGLRIMAHVYAWRECATQKLAELSQIPAAVEELAKEREISHTRADIQTRFDEILKNAATQDA